MNIQFLEEAEVSTVHTVDDPLLVELAQKALKARTVIADAQLEEDTVKGKLALGALGIALSDINNGQYTGCVRVASSNESPVRIEMRLTKGAMKVAEEQRLGEAFGPLYTEFFETGYEILRILDYNGLIAAIKKDGLNPWKYLKLEVRSGCEADLVRYKQYLVHQEAIIPVKGFFGRLNEYATKLKAKAVNFLKEYLPQAIEPSVILGTKGKK